MTLNIPPELIEALRRKDVDFISKQLFPNVEAAQNLKFKQRRIVRIIAFSEKRRVTVSAYTRYGKTQVVAIAVSIYILINEDKKIKFIGPSIDLAGLIRDYMAELILDCAPLLAMADLEATGTQRLKKEASRNRLTFNNGCEYRVITAHGKGFAAMGHGGDLIIMDECALISRESYAKITRMLGDDPENSVLVELYNPWSRDTKAYDHSISARFTHIQISYKDGIAEGRTTVEYIEEQREDITPMEFQVLYESRFPDDEYENTIIKIRWIQRALREPPKTKELPFKVLGVDIARFGTDLTVFCYVEIYENYIILKGVKDYAKEDTEVTADNIEKADIKIGFDRIIPDDTGVGGGVTDKLNHREQTRSKVSPFIFGESTIMSEKDKKRFLNIKAKYFFHLAKMFEDGKIYIYKHDKLMQELNSIRFEVGKSSGKIVIIDPEKSPDFADSLMMACSNLKTGANYSVLEDTKGVIF
jgi:hypothetical protein